MGTDICSGKLFVKAAEVALSPSASKDCMQLSPAQPKRQLEVQLSEVSDETCDRAAVSFLASLEQHGFTAGSPHAKKPKTSLACCQPAADDAGSTPSTPANPSTGAHAGAAALQNHVSLQQHLIGRISTPMGPPAAVGTGQLSLGSLLVAAQMASGGAASNSNGRVGGTSPLLLATQATLQATTASVVAAEVLAAVSRPGGISSISTACAGTGVSPAALAGILAGSISPGQAHTAVSATGPMQLQQQVVLDSVHQRAASAPPAAAPHVQVDQDVHAAPMREQDTVPADSGAQRTSAQQMAQGAGQVSLAALKAASAGGAAPAQEQQQASMDTDMLQDIPADTPSVPAPSPGPAGAAAAAAAAAAAGVTSTPAAPPAKPQLPSWLCETSPELKASQAICKASLHTATAALARLSSPRGLSLSAAVAAHKGAAAHAPSVALPPAAFAGKAHWARHGAVGTGGAAHTPAVFAGAYSSSWAAAAAPALRGPSLAPGALSPVRHHVPAVPAPAVVFGIPARDIAAGVHTVWGLPVCANAAAVAASNTAAMLSAQHQAAAAAAAAAATTADGVVHLRVRKIHGSAAPAVSAESEMADAGSCSSTPKAAAATAAAAGATGRLAAAALKLSMHSQPQQQQQRQQQGRFFDVSNCCESAALTADDASSPMCCADNDVTSGLTAGGDSAAELDAAADAAAAVVVHVEVKHKKASTSAAAAAAATAAPAKQ